MNLKIAKNGLSHGLNPQVTPEVSQSMVKILKYHPNTPKLSLRHPNTSPNSIRHCRQHHRISSKTLKVIIWCVSMRKKVEPSYHFSTTLKCKIFSPDHFETSKYQNRHINPNPTQVRFPVGIRKGSRTAPTMCSTLLGSAFQARQALIWPRI